jgi:hypothetical protein
MNRADGSDEKSFRGAEGREAENILRVIFSFLKACHRFSINNKFRPLITPDGR